MIIFLLLTKVGPYLGSFSFSNIFCKNALIYVLVVQANALKAEKSRVNLANEVVRGV